MSQTKIVDIGKFIKELKGLKPEQVKEKLCEKLYTAYGRYETSSGQMFFEMYHHGDPDAPEQGMVVFQKGVVNKPLEVDELLTREVALDTFLKLVRKGYERVFEAVTKEDMDAGNAKLRQNMSNAQREGILGTYHNGDHFVRLHQFGSEFSVERGYDGRVTSAKHDLTEEQAKELLTEAKAEGFKKPSNSEGLFDEEIKLENIFDEEEQPEEKPYSNNWLDAF